MTELWKLQSKVMCYKICPNWLWSDDAASIWLFQYSLEKRPVSTRYIVV